MQLQESGEMYLETIYILSLQNPAVHSIDIAAHLGYSKPSISRAMGVLRDGGFLFFDEDNALHLTESGLAVAKNIYGRHVMLTEFLESLGVSSQNASLDACRIEHVISEESVQAIRRFLQK